MAFVIVTGLPCSGKSTFIGRFARNGEAVFKVDGVDNDPAEIIARRNAFIAKHRRDARAWVEASSLSPSLRRSLYGALWTEVQMKTDARTCLARLSASDRPDKDVYRQIILRKAANQGIKPPPSGFFHAVKQ